MSVPKEALAGRTVIVTRPRSRSDALARELTRAGARVIAVPLIRIAPPPSFVALDRALRDLAAFDFVVFASRNAVERFFARAKALRLGRLNAPRRVFAIGPDTASAARARGWNVQPLADRFDGGSLARAIKGVRGRRVLIPRAASGREELPRELRRRGAVVVCASAYRTVADRAGAARLRSAARGGVDAVTFTSPSTVEKFMSALGAPRAKRLLEGATAVSIGPVTSAALKRRGLRSIQAPQATAAAMIEALSTHFAP